MIFLFCDVYGSRSLELCDFVTIHDTLALMINPRELMAKWGTRYFRRVILTDPVGQCRLFYLAPSASLLLHDARNP